MRFIFRSTKRALRRARRLQRALERYLPGIKLSKAQELVALMIGYRDWHELAAETGTGDGPYDEDVSALECSRRLDRQIDVLKGLGMPYVHAFDIVAALRLTAHSAPRSFPESDLFNAYYGNQPEDLDYEGLGFAPPEGWLKSLSSESGLLVISGDTGSGKSVMARATLKEARARRGPGSEILVLDGSPRDFSQLKSGLRFAGKGVLVIATMDDGRHDEALEHLRHDVFQVHERFLGWMRIRRRKKPGAVSEHRICLYDGYVHPGEAAKHDYAWKWYEPRLVAGYETLPDWVHRWGA